MSGRPVCNAAAQRIAMQTLSRMHELIQVGMSEADIAGIACRLMKENGSGELRSNSAAAMVLLGERNALRQSGKDYLPDPGSLVSENDVITIDLSPSIGGYRGGCARTFFMEEGKLAPEDSPVLPENRRGMEAELHLHEYLLNQLDPGMSYGRAFEILNGVIEGMGFVNAGFRGILGRSIGTGEQGEILIMKGNPVTFRQAGKPFSLETCIRRMEGGAVFRRKDIYYIDGDRFARL